MLLQEEDHDHTRTTAVPLVFPVPFGMSTFSAAQGNISLAQKHLTSSTCVGKKGQKCPKASLRPLAVGCVAMSHADAHHQTRPPWPFAATAFPSGPESWKGLGMPRGPWAWHRTHLLRVSRGRGGLQAQETSEHGAGAQGLQGCSQASAGPVHTYSDCALLRGCGSSCLPSGAFRLAPLWPLSF